MYFGAKVAIFRELPKLFYIFAVFYFKDSMCAICIF